MLKLNHAKLFPHHLKLSRPHRELSKQTGRKKIVLPFTKLGWVPWFQSKEKSRKYPIQFSLENSHGALPRCLEHWILYNKQIFDIWSHAPDKQQMVAHLRKVWNIEWAHAFLLPSSLPTLPAMNSCARCPRCSYIIPHVILSFVLNAWVCAFSVTT